MRERDRRSRPGRVQIPPQAYSVMNSWKSAVQLGGAARRPVDVRGAEHLAAHGHPEVADLRDGQVVPLGSAADVVADQAGDHVGGLGGRQVGDSVEHDQPAVGDARRDGFQPRGRRHRVGRAGHREHRPRDLPEPVAHVELRERAAHRDVALVVGVAQGVQEGASPVGLPLGEPGAEPALHRCLDEAGRPGSADRVDPFAPGLRPADPGTGAQQGGAGDPVRRVEQELEADRPADRVAGVVEGPRGSGRR